MNLKEIEPFIQEGRRSLRRLDKMKLYSKVKFSVRLPEKTAFLKFIGLILCVLMFINKTSATNKDNQIPIQCIEFIGLEKISEKQALDWFNLKKGSNLDLGQISKHAQDFILQYAKLGMPYTAIDSILYEIAIDSSHAELEIYITEGEEIKMDNLHLAGTDSSFIEGLAQHFRTREGQDINVKTIDKDFDEVLTAFGNDGYPYTQITLEKITLEPQDQHKQLGLYYKVSPGPKLKIQEIQIVGNELTKDYVVLRNMGIQKGDFYQEEKVKQISDKLRRTGYFRRVEDPRIYYSEGSNGGLLIKLEEGPTSRFDGIVGYNPGTGTEPGYFTGMLDISLGNLLGTGRSLLAHWQKRDQDSQELKFHYMEPWVLGLPFNMGAGFEQLIQDTTYVQRQFGVNVDILFFDNLKLSGHIGRSEITPDSIGSFLFGIPKSRTLNASIGFEYDTRDDLINPRHGIYYHNTLQAGKKENLGPDSLITDLALKQNISNKRILIDFELYTEFLKRQVLALGLHGKQIQSNEEKIPMPDLFRLGGTSTLRGYREDQFRGSSIAWANMEYRYILGRRSRAFVFLDAGYVVNDQIEQTKIGYGFGFRLETGLGIMGIDYGLGEGDDFSNGKIHVGLVNEF